MGKRRGEEYEKRECIRAARVKETEENRQLYVCIDICVCLIYIYIHTYRQERSVQEQSSARCGMAVARIYRRCCSRSGDVGGGRQRWKWRRRRRMKDCAGIPVNGWKATAGNSIAADRKITLGCQRHGPLSRLSIRRYTNYFINIFIRTPLNSPFYPSVGLTARACPPPTAATTTTLLQK